MNEQVSLIKLKKHLSHPKSVIVLSVEWEK